ncbi:DUF2946 family protein [Methylocapsa sp. S129]|uniref:DUF2946 family protein n=1 Tax=Methylocapsa sp. S129 TaxID=1641869 RepID=UPI00131CDFF8|nr:DUF2946 family protein [Methylocapsa sp. S129]
MVAWVAVLALILQLGLAPAPRAMASAGEADAAAALGALSALLGPNVALCLHEDGSAPGSPSHDSHDCCIDCTLCQLTGHAAALVPPNHAVPLGFARIASRLSIPSDARVARPPLVASAQPRAPPISA